MENNASHTTFIESFQRCEMNNEIENSECCCFWFFFSFHLVILCLFGCKLQNIAEKHIYTLTHISFLHGFDFNEQSENRSW